MAPAKALTPTQQRMLAVLQDGAPHSRQELHACLNDELQPVSNVAMHVCYMRPVLIQQGLEIVFNARSRTYRLARHINSGE